VCHTGTCLHIFVSSITWCSCEIFRHTPNSFRFSARNTQSCKVSLWRLTAVQEMASFNKCTWNLSTPLSIPTYQNMSKHQRKISQVYHGRKVDVLTLYHFKLTFPWHNSHLDNSLPRSRRLEDLMRSSGGHSPSETNPMMNILLLMGPRSNSYESYNITFWVTDPQLLNSWGTRTHTSIRKYKTGPFGSTHSCKKGVPVTVAKAASRKIQNRIPGTRSAVVH